MDIPVIPTDNLYKFLSFAGLVILIGPPLYLNNSVKHLEVEVAKLSTEVELIEKVGDREYIIDISKKSAELDILVSQKERELKQIYFSLFFGAFLTVCGLHLWYSRVQKPNDEILRRQTNQEKNI